MTSRRHTELAIRPRSALPLRVAVMSVVAMLATGCSTGGLMGSKSEGTTSSGSVPFTDRISSLFGRSPQTPAASPGPATPATEEFDCPRIDIRQGASTLLINAGQGQEEASALTLRYQGTFVRAARECRVTGNTVNIRVGVEGRVILGPAGSAGRVTIPLRYALVSETLTDSRTVWTKLHTIPVEIPPQTPNVNFTHIVDDLTVPIPSPAELSNWVIYIGFDPEGAQMEQRQQRRPARRAQQ